MADEEQRGTYENQMEIKIEPGTIEYYERENGFEMTSNNASTNSDINNLNLWTSKATSCLIAQYKKYRSMVGQSTRIRSLRGMFETISLEMRKHGFHFSPQKCENKWRVLERKYKNLVFRERLKKPGRMRHYGQWEHKRAMDEIFSERRRHAYFLEEDGLAVNSVAARPCNSQNIENNDASQRLDPLAATAVPSSNEGNGEVPDRKDSTFLERIFEEINRNVALIERNMERRHKEEMAIRQSELEIQKRLLSLKEQKMELQRCQILTAAQRLHLNSQ